MTNQKTTRKAPPGAPQARPVPDEAQARFAESRGAPLIALSAPPGTGKTEALLQRFLSCVEGGTPPDRIVMATYTNRARGAFEERVRAAGIAGVSELAIPPQERAGRRLDALPPLWIGTIHDICRRVLDCHWTGGSSGRELRVVQHEELRTRMRQALEDTGSLPRGCHDAGRAVGACLAAAEAVKRAGGDPALDGASDPVPPACEAQRLPEEWAAAIRLHQERMAADGRIDPDELLSRTWRLFHREPDVRAAWARRFDHVLLDEYQDTGAIATGIAGMLGRNAEIAVAGDREQSVYGWRGAGAGFAHLAMLRPTHGDPRMMELGVDHRLTAEIQAAASGLRRRMAEPGPEPEPSPRHGPPAWHCEVSREAEEPEAIAGHIQAAVESDPGSELHDCAVLARTHAGKSRVGKGLAALGVPVWLAGSVQEGAPGGALLAWLSAVVRRDDPSVERALCSPAAPGGGVRPADLAPARTASMAQGVPLWSRLAGSPPPAEGPLRDSVALLRDLSEGMERRQAEAEWSGARHWPFGTVRRVSEALGLEARAAAQGGPEEASLQDLLQLARALGERCPDEATLLELLERSAGDLERAPPGHVEVRTMHSAKGLEFRHVFAPGWQEGIFPAPWRSVDLEEERRLALVTVTRASRSFVSYSARTALDGSSALPSRHVREAGLEVIPWTGRAAQAGQPSQAPQAA